MVGQDEPDPDAALARELREPRQERLADPTALMGLGDVNLVDEKLRAVAMPPQELVAEDEADRMLAVEGDEKERARVGEEPFRVAWPVVRL